MGIFWDLMQQDELEKQEEQAKNVEERVAILEKELANTRAILKKKVSDYLSVKENNLRIC